MALTLQNSYLRENDQLTLVVSSDTEVFSQQTQWRIRKIDGTYYSIPTSYSYALAYTELYIGDDDFNYRSDARDITVEYSNEFGANFHRVTFALPDTREYNYTVDNIFGLRGADYTPDNSRVDFVAITMHGGIIQTTIGDRQLRYDATRDIAVILANNGYSNVEDISGLTALMTIPATGAVPFAFSTTIPFLGDTRSGPLGPENILMDLSAQGAWSIRLRFIGTLEGQTIPNAQTHTITIDSLPITSVSSITELVTIYRALGLNHPYPTDLADTIITNELEIPGGTRETRTVSIVHDELNVEVNIDHGPAIALRLDMLEQQILDAQKSTTSRLVEALVNGYGVPYAPKDPGNYVLSVSIDVETSEVTRVWRTL